MSDNIRRVWIGLHAEVTHPDDPERLMLLGVRVAELKLGGSGRVTLDDVPQDDVSFQQALIEELNRALHQVRQGALHLAEKAVSR